MESQPQNPEFRNNPENFHPWRFGTTKAHTHTCSNDQTHQSLSCLHTQKTGIDEDLDKKFNLAPQ